MNLLVTAGNTHVPIDRVRVITNIFSGRTGAAIAVEAYRRGHTVTLLTSRPDAVPVLDPVAGDSERWRCLPYQTFAELRDGLEQLIACGNLDAVIQAAAVSDYDVAGIFAAAPGTDYDVAACAWHGDPPTLADRAAGKVKSDAPELWLRLVRTPKLIDCVRRDWGFRGILVKFKLEVAIPEAELLAVAERSRRQSQADWMVANTLEGSADWAYLGSAAGYTRLARPALPAKLLDVIEGQCDG